MQRLIRSFNTLTDGLKKHSKSSILMASTTTSNRSHREGDLLRVIEAANTEALYLIKIDPESREEVRAVP
ncbi:MAG: hypothetical protein IPG92_04180 [Flavobacteriales bacterium]|nr:hypothetical protein [Flavobacteriales bacterium]